MTRYILQVGQMLTFDTNAGEDSGRETLDLAAVVSLPGARQLQRVFWAYRTAKKAWRRATRKGARTFR
eukprot:9370867-Lingulodinium_polyedra.AAC.1